MCLTMHLLICSGQAFFDWLTVTDWLIGWNAFCMQSKMKKTTEQLVKSQLHASHSESIDSAMKRVQFIRCCEPIVANSHRYSLSYLPARITYSDLQQSTIPCTDRAICRRQTGCRQSLAANINESWRQSGRRQARRSVCSTEQVERCFHCTGAFGRTIRVRALAVSRR